MGSLKPLGASSQQARWKRGLFLLLAQGSRLAEAEARAHTASESAAREVSAAEALRSQVAALQTELGDLQQNHSTQVSTIVVCKWPFQMPSPQ